MRAGQSGVSRKRKRVEMYSSSSSGMRQMRAGRYDTTSTETKGVIEVHEIDEDGQYIKLYNNSTKVGGR